MAGLGSVYVELQLDRSKFDRSLQQLEKDATSTPIQIEKAFANLGIKSSYQFDLLRQKAINNYEAIKQSAQATANDILRAEQAKNAQLKALDAQQFGARKSMLTNLKSHWLETTAAITAAYFAMSKAWAVAGEAADYQERVSSLDALAAQAKLTGRDVVQSMQEAARGLLSMQDAANLAASALNLSLTPTQMIEFTRVAEQMTDVIGGTIPEAFNRMTVAAASGRTQTLAQMGILVDLDAAYKAYAASVGKATDDLSLAEKQHVRLNVILDAAKAKVAALGEATDSARDHMDRLTAQVKDLGLALGEGLLVAGQAAMGIMQTLASGTLTAGQAITKVAQAYAQAAAWGNRLTGDTEGDAAWDARAAAMQLQADTFGTAAEDLARKASENLFGSEATTQAAKSAVAAAYGDLATTRMAQEEAVAAVGTKAHLDAIKEQAEDEAKWWVKEIERQQAEDEKLQRYENERLAEKTRAAEKAAADEVAAARKVREEQIALWDGLNTKIPQAAATASAAVVASAATMTDAFAQASAAASMVAAGISAGGSTPGSALGVLQKGGSGLAGRWEETEREWANSRLAEMSERWGGMPIPADIASKYMQLQLHGGVGQAALESAVAQMGLDYLNAKYAVPGQSQMQTDYTSFTNNGILPGFSAGQNNAPFEESAPLSLDTGGIVPGPVGAAQPAIVHGGEAVFTPAQLAALAQAGGSRGGDLVVRVQLDGTALTQALRIPLQTAIRAGQVVVQ